MRAIPPETREELEKLERKHAENPEGRYFVPLANALRKVGDTARAMELLREGIGRHPEYVSAHIVLGRCLQDDGALADAESRFRHVLSLDGQNLVALRALGDIAGAKGDAAAARGWYDQLLEVDPMNEEARAAISDLAAAAPAPHSAGGEPTFAGEPFRPAEDEWGEPDAADSAARGSFEDQAAEDLPSGATTGWEDARFLPQADSEAPISGTGVDEEKGDDRMNDWGPPPDLEESSDDFETEGPVITETIAELYVRQGFYDRAVSVYRELIRRRGSDANLAARLSRAERLASGEIGPTDEPDAATASSAPEDEGASDYFADSFSTGFPAEDARTDVWEFGSNEPSGSEAVAPATAPAVDPAPAVSIGDYLRAVLSWRPNAEAHNGDESSGDEEDASLKPLGAAEALSGEPAEPEAGTGTWPQPDEDVEHDFVEGYTWANQPDVPPLADVSHTHEHVPAESAPETRSRFEWFEADAASSEEEDDLPGEIVAVGPDVSRDPVAPQPKSDDSDLFPWELPPSRTESDAARPAPASEPADAGRSSEPEIASSESRFAESAHEVRHTEPFSMDPPSSRETGPAPTASERQSPPSEEDDDLESFQAWLRSLKR